jgi:type I restriction enzyme S subunit
MELETFFEQFELLADAPNGVQKLRELILQLAVQGKLVPQDPNDEPASVLLEKIEAEKKRLMKEGKIKNSLKLLPVAVDEISLELPSSWLCICLGDCIELISGQHLGKNEQNEKGEGLPYLTGPADFGEVNPTATRWTVTPKAIAKKNDVLITVKGAGVGKTNILALNEAAIGRQLMAIRPIFVEVKYVYLLVLASYEKFQALGTGSTVPGISREDILNFILPLPPLSEQNRIVAKVDRLMSLCDELEARQEKRRDRILQLGEVATSQLLTPSTPEAFNQHWQGICDNFDLLYSTPENVSQLRQAILQLAVMGKLVPWEESKDNLENLIEEIYRENFAFNLSKRDREQVLREFEIVRQNAHSYNSGLFKIKAMCICDFITKGTTPASNELLPEGDIPYIKVYNIIKNKLDFFYNPVFISKITHETKLKRSKVFPGDVLMNIVGPPLGKVAIVNDEFPEWNINQALAIFRPVKSIDNKFLYYVLSCYSTLEEVLKETKGTAGQDNLSLEQCRNLQIPLYPLSIQKCIVAKVEQLMSLCDELEAKLKQSISDRKKLMETAVRQVLAA